MKNLKPRITAINTRRTAPAVERLRGRPWERIRQRVLQRDDYLCVECLKAGRVELAREVDHIVPLHKGGIDAESNLQSLCFACHQTKSEREERERKG